MAKASGKVRMKILTKKVQTETAVKNSRFIAEAFPCSEQAEARKIIKSQKEKYFDARHVVHAFVLGVNAEIFGASDDGEPSGTAGRPALDVLKGSGLTNILITITRYFGGTLLGTGGLVKAYGGAAKSVLEEAEKIGATEEFVRRKDFSFECSYSAHKAIKRILQNFSLCDLREEFSDIVCVSGKIAEDEYEEFFKEVRAVTFDNRHKTR